MNYTTSRDYEELWKLVQENEIPCLYWDEDTQRAGFTRKAYRAAFTPGLSYCSTREGFIQRCKEEQVEFLPPTTWIKIESDKDLPSAGKKYLLRCKYGTEAGIFNNGVFRSQITDVTLSGVTHWMPMPEAPKE